jgi:hypothetical protein
LAEEEEVEAVLAPHLAVVAQPPVLPVRGRLPLLQAVVVPLVLPVRAHLVLLALLRVVVVLPVLAVEAAPAHLLSRQSFSAAMARSTP